MRKKGKDWKQSEIDFLKANWHLRNDYLASHLGRTIDAVKSKKHQMKRDSICAESIPEKLSQSDKVVRIYKLAAEMRVRLEG